MLCMIELYFDVEFRITEPIPILSTHYRRCRHWCALLWMKASSCLFHCFVSSNSSPVRSCSLLIWLFIYCHKIDIHTYIHNSSPFGDHQNRGQWIPLHAPKLKHSYTVCVFKKINEFIYYVYSRSSGSIARKALQALEALKLVEKVPDGGRILTTQGRRDLDRIAAQVRLKAKQAAKQQVIVL